MVDFDVHADRLRAEADTRLGDSILYAVNGATGGDFVAMKARLMEAEPPAGWEPRDEMQGGWRLKIAKALVAKPSKADRIQCDPILGAGLQYRPTAKDPVDAGRYWFVDIERV